MNGAVAERTAYRLNVNKTKFYRLAKQFFPEIGPMKAARFVKHPRSRDYALDFKSGEYYHHLFLSIYRGEALLGDNWYTYEEDGSKVSAWESNNLTIDELRKFDMIEEIGPDSSVGRDHVAERQGETDE